MQPSYLADAVFPSYFGKAVIWDALDVLAHNIANAAAMGFAVNTAYHTGYDEGWWDRQRAQTERDEREAKALLVPDRQLILPGMSGF